MFFCLYLMASLPVVTWIRFFVWMAIGLVIYFSYGRFHSRVDRNNTQSLELDAASSKR
jgi:APA family basic amino acid/polyamine antiporter